MVLIKDVMSKNVIIIEENKTIFEAADKMCSKGISSLVIIESDKVKGIITRRDIFEKVMIKKLDPEKILVKEIMSFPVVVLNENASLIAASGLMKSRKIKQIPIISDNNNIIGIITQTDIILNINCILGFDKKDKDLNLNEVI
jgi:CBS domain-containing protein